MSTAAQASLFPAPAAPRTFVGCGQWAGWRFELTPAMSPDYPESPGYLLRTLVVAPVTREDLLRSAERHERLYPRFAADIRARAEHREDEWREERWLVEWLKDGSIREERRA